MNEEETLKNKIVLNVGLIALCYYILTITKEIDSLVGINVLFTYAMVSFIFSLLTITTYFTSQINERTKNKVHEIFNLLFDYTVWAIITLVILALIFNYVPNILSAKIVSMKKEELASYIGILLFFIFIYITAKLHKEKKED